MQCFAKSSSSSSFVTSRGEPIVALRAAFPRVVDSLEEYQQHAGKAANDFSYFNAYVYALWIVSLAILLDVGDAEWHRVIKDLGNEERDALFDRLVALRIPDRVPTTTLMYPRALRATAPRARRHGRATGETD